MNTPVTIVPPKLSPSETARLELLALSGREEFQSIARIGGKLSAEEIEENAHRKQKYEEAWLEIIARHGVINEYLAPLYQEAYGLAASLAEVRSKITKLEALKHKAAG